MGKGKAKLARALGCKTRSTSWKDSETTMMTTTKQSLRSHKRSRNSVHLAGVKHKKPKTNFATKKTTKKAKPHRKRTQFKLHLPDAASAQNTSFIPWMRPRFLPSNAKQKQTQSLKDSKKRSSRRVKLPTDQFPSLDRFDAELTAFARYVQLSETELETRRHLVQNLQTLSEAIFDHHDPQQDVSVQVFGSFATPAVCVFSSDVDVALWGVVPPLQPRIPHRRTKGLPPEREQPQRNCKMQEQQQQHKVDKWKQAFAALDAENATAPDETPVKEASQPQDEQHQEQVEDILGKLPRRERRHNRPTEQRQQPQRNCKAPLQQTQQQQQLLKVDNWNATFAALDAENAAVPDETPVKEIQQQKEEDEDLPLFLIDREGMDLSTDKTTAQEENVATTTIAAAEELAGDPSDEDTADKLEAFVDNVSSSSATAASSSSRNITRNDATHPVSLTASSSSSSASNDWETADDSSNDDNEHKHMQVSIVASPAAAAVTNQRRQPSGPRGHIRTQVVDALAILRRRLRKCSLTRNITLIQARVPILKLITHMGVEMDVAVGGHNGTDTSLFAALQAEKFESFSAVVLFLKILLNQQGLDIPFMGGLGSYKLYVMVAYHLQQHLALGGNDRPAEVLLSFFFRYGEVRGHNKASPKTRTTLDQDKPLQYTSNSEADLSNVFHLEHIVHLFRRCWERLCKNLGDDSNNKSSSWLLHLINADRLLRERQACLRQSVAALREWNEPKRKRQRVA